MKTKVVLSFFILFAILLSSINAIGKTKDFQPIKSSLDVGEYAVIIEGYDWGAAVSKVILPMEETVTSVEIDDFSVQVERKSECGEITQNASGERTVIYGYVSDDKGNRLEEGVNITLVMSVGPNLPLGSPLQYFRGENCRGTTWIDYEMTITNTSTNQKWDTQAKQIMPIVDDFSLSGSFTYKDITMSYASFIPKTENKKSPLLIWLHGGGEGGSDPTIPLLGNKAANYASDEIQDYFSGAYVLVPQCPTRWMDTGKGSSTSGEENDMYNEPLMALIKEYVAANPGIDANRIYVGGCSNGGYESLKLLLLHPDYFAAGFISSVAYKSAYLTDTQIESIKNVPIWFVHSADDGTTVPEETCLPIYKRLIDSGAKNIHMSFYDHVVDITGFFGGENYNYPGHWSWVYLHANKCKYDFDGTIVKVDGRPATIMEWLAAQKN